MSGRAPADEIGDRPSRTVATMTNPYAPPLASVRDIAEPHATAVPADRSTRLAATFLDTIIFALMVYLPLMILPVLMRTGADAGADVEAGTGNADTLLVILGVLTLVGFVAWLLAHDQVHEAQRPVDRQEDARHQGRPHRRLTGVARAHLLAAQCRERADQHHPALRARSTCCSSSANRGSACTTRSRTPSSSRPESTRGVPRNVLDTVVAAETPEGILLELRPAGLTRPLLRVRCSTG